MKLSVVILNHNHAEDLEKCVESVVRQSFVPYEILISYNDSTADSSKIAKSLSVKYNNVRCLLYEGHHGEAGHRHWSVLQATGDYVTLLNSNQSYYDSEKLEREMHLIKKYLNEGKDIIAYSYPVYVDQKGKLKKTFESQVGLVTGDLLYSILTWSHMVPLDFILKKELYTNAVGSDSDSPLEEWELKIKLAAKAEFYCIERPGISCKEPNNTDSYPDLENHIKSLRTVFNQNLHLLPSHLRSSAKQDFNAYILRLFFKHSQLNGEEKKVLIDIFNENGFIHSFHAKSEMIASSLSRIGSEDSVVVYGAGEHTARLLKTFDFSSFEVPYIVDKNESLKGMKRFNYIVETPSKILEEPPGHVIISSYDYQNEIETYLRSDLKYSGDIITFYDEHDNHPFYQFEPGINELANGSQVLIDQDQFIYGERSRYLLVPKNMFYLREREGIEKFADSGDFYENTQENFEIAYSHPDRLKEYENVGRHEDYRYMYEHFKDYIKQDDRVCEIGCGMGGLLKTMIDKLPYEVDISGCDFAESAINYCRQRFLRENAEFKVGDILQLSYENNCFDLTLCTEVLEHIENFRLAYKELVRITRPEGHLFITVPNGVKDSYLGHINFWDLVNFQTFLAGSEPVKIIKSGFLGKGDKKLYAILKKTD